MFAVAVIGIGLTIVNPATVAAGDPAPETSVVDAPAELLGGPPDHAPAGGRYGLNWRSSPTPPPTGEGAAPTEPADPSEPSDQAATDPSLPGETGTDTTAPAPDAETTDPADPADPADTDAVAPGDHGPQPEAAPAPGADPGHVAAGPAPPSGPAPAAPSAAADTAPKPAPSSDDPDPSEAATEPDPEADPGPADPARAEPRQPSLVETAEEIGTHAIVKAHVAPSRMAPTGTATRIELTAVVTPSRDPLAPRAVALELCTMSVGDDGDQEPPIDEPDHIRVAVGASVGMAAMAPRVTTTVSVAMDFARLSGGWAGPLVFNFWLRRQLRERRLTQRQLAAQSGVNHSTISRLLSDQRTPSLETAAKLVHALRLEWSQEQVATYFDLLPERTLFPTQRVESALRGDPDLEETDVRRIMDAYLVARSRRRAAERAEAAEREGPPAQATPSANPVAAGRPIRRP